MTAELANQLWAQDEERSLHTAVPEPQQLVDEDWRHVGSMD